MFSPQDALPIVLGRVSRQSGAGRDGFRRPGQFACPQGIEQVASDDETVALPPCQSFALEECGALGQCALDLGSEPAAGMGCLGRQQLPVEPGRTVRSEEHTSEHQSLMRISSAVFCSTKKKK